MSKRPNGLSMIEVIVAFGVLAMALLALLGCMPAAARMQNCSTLSTQALYLAEQKMDFLLKQDQRLATIPESDYPLGDLSFNRQWWGGGVAGHPDLQRIEVLVTWMERGRPHEIHLQCFLVL
ncbi:MAG: hypothetical protein ACOX9B_06510 [Candidatus Xenobium sp.]|jgi:type II secretory pathway pseudopilin PulG|nr:hypothetical protein [Burkholderiales bacterium]